MTADQLFRGIRLYQNFLAAGFSVLVLIYEGLIGTAPKEIGLVYLSIIFAKYAITGYQKSLEFSVAVALIALFFTPTLLSVVASDGSFLKFLAFSQLFASALTLGARHFFRRSPQKEKLSQPFKAKTWLALLAVMVFAWHLRLDLNSPVNAILFFATFAASLVLFEKSIFELSIFRIRLIILTYWLVLLYYIFFFWSGFGRLVIGAYFLMPLLIANQHRDIGARVWHLVFILPFVLVGAYMFRYGTSQLTWLLEDSWSSHLILTQEMTETLSTRHAPGLGEYLNQYMLLFFQWLPRSIWPSKPIGIGLTFVDDWMGRAGVDAGHSVALGYIGETMWYLGPWFPIGLTIIFLTLLSLRALAYSFDRNGYVLFAMLDSYLPSFFWGGMATYGSRFWFFFLPSVATLYLLRLRFRQR